MKHWKPNSDVVITFEDDGDWRVVGIAAHNAQHSN